MRTKVLVLLMICLFFISCTITTQEIKNQSVSEQPTQVEIVQSPVIPQPIIVKEIKKPEIKEDINLEENRKILEKTYKALKEEYDKPDVKTEAFVFERKLIIRKLLIFRINKNTVTIVRRVNGEIDMINTFNIPNLKKMEEKDLDEF